MKMKNIFLLLLLFTTISCTPKMSLDPVGAYSDPNALKSPDNSGMTLEEAQNFLSKLKLDFQTKEDTAANLTIVDAANIERLGEWQIKIVKNPLGILNLGFSSGIYRFEPIANFHGTTSFEVALSRKDQQTKSVVGKITVESIIESGKSNDVTWTSNEDIIGPDNSLNFTNPDNLTVSFSFNNNQVSFAATETQKTSSILDPMGGKTLGELSMPEAGRFRFVPASNLNGNYSFNYQVFYFSNGNFIGSSVAKVNLVIVPVNDSPTINVTELNALKNTVLSVDLRAITSDPDGFGLDFSITNPVHGTAEIDSNQNLKFTPETNHVSTNLNFASVTLNVRGINSNLETTRTLKISVAETNHAPVLNMGSTLSFNKDEDQIFTLDFSASDADGDPLTFTANNTNFKSQSVGTAEVTHLNGNSYRLTFTPVLNFFGLVTLKIEVGDGIAKATQQLSIDYTEVADPLVINTVPYSVNENSTIQIALKDIVSVPDADAMLLHINSSTIANQAALYRNSRLSGSLTTKTNPSHGTITISGSADFRAINYIPTAMIHGSDSASLELTDTVGSNKYTINLSFTINAIVPVLSISTNSYSLIQNTTIPEINFSNSGGGIDSCSVSPTLPAGLSLNSSTCKISGKPTSTMTSKEYSITASNDAGSSTSKINIAVIFDRPILGLSSDLLTLTRGTAMTEVIFSNSGGPADSCSSSSPLPSGLSLSVDGSTCKISGTPTTAQIETWYLIQGENTTGKGTVLVKIQVLNPPKIGNLGTYTIIKGQTLSVSPVNSGGEIKNCSVSPSLPVGLTISANSCAISGAVDTVQSATAYSVTASNDEGTSTGPFSLTVIPPRPVLNATTDKIMAMVGTPINNTNFSNTSGGGPIEKCETTSPLPNGLQIALTNDICVISGTPSQQLPSTQFTVKASNGAGEATANLTIQIDPNAEDLSTIGLDDYIRVPNLTNATPLNDERIADLVFEPEDTCASFISTSVVYLDSCPRGPINGTRYYSHYRNHKTYLKKGDPNKIIALRTRTDYVYFKYSNGWQPWARYGYQEIVEYDKVSLGQNLKVIKSYKCAGPGFWIDCSGAFSSLIQNDDNTFTVLWSGYYSGPFLQIINVSADGNLDQAPVESKNSIGAKLPDFYFKADQFFRDKNGDYVIWSKASRFSYEASKRYIVKVSPQNKLVWKGLAQDLWIDDFNKAYVLPSGQLAIEGAPNKATLGGALVNGGSLFAAIINSGEKSFLLKGDFDGNGIITPSDLDLARDAQSDLDSYEDQFGHQNTRVIADLNYDDKFDSADISILNNYLSSSTDSFMQGLDIVLKMDPKDLEF